MSKIVTFEQAKKLKDFGFDGECLYWYNEDGVKECPIEQGYMEYYYEVDCFLNDWNAKKIDRDLYGSYPPKVSYSVPTVSEALDWVREEKRVICAVDVDYFDGWYYTGKYQDMTKTDFRYTDSFDDHPLASSALLTAVLTYLEQKEKK